MEQKHVLLIHTSWSTFVRSDNEILSSEFIVKSYHFKPLRGVYKTFIQWWKQLFFLLFNASDFDVFFIWFADMHAFLPVFFGKIMKRKSMLVIGGFDATSLPGIGYGLFCANPFRQFAGKYAIRNADFILPVDVSLVKNTNYFAGADDGPLHTGFTRYVKNIRGRIIPLPTGYDPGFWTYDPGKERSNSVLTVAYITHWQRWYLKGCDFLQTVAEAMPEIDFHIYGISPAMLDELGEKQMPSNFYLHGFTRNEDLPGIFRTHGIYAQFSLSEGLPNVLCEAMLCGCIPVGSDVNGIPGAIGDDRLVIPRPDAGKAAEVIRFAQSLPSDYREVFRKRIIEKFPAGKRSLTLKQLISG